MKRKYLICDVSILPECYEKVVEARELVETGKAKDVSEAVRITGISRSTYYKYKDYLFAPGKDSNHGKKAILSFQLAHKTGALSEVLSLVSQMNANILTINQNLPVRGKAYITLSVEFSKMKIDPADLVSAISLCSGVSSVKLVAIE
ncbi:MAG: ACT domain-containing protein [Ruminococcaceae bacterium]|nr:ACT domain-containing protein [Oscillospiraceae bacterium]